MTYELFLSDNPLKNSFLDKLVDQSQSSQWELLRGLKTWVSRIQQGNMENFPLIHVLEGEYEQKDMYISSLNAADRSVAMAAIRATRDERLTPHDGYTLSAYLVIVKATSKNYSARSRVRYSIEWAITLFGALVPDIKALLVNETGVLQTDRFQDGQTTSRQVTKTMHTTTKTVAVCISFSSPSLPSICREPTNQMFSSAWCMFGRTERSSRGCCFCFFGGLGPVYLCQRYLTPTCIFIFIRPVENTRPCL